MIEATAHGSLHLVSTGCGDYENITLRAIRIIREAEVIVCTKVPNPEVQELIQGKEIIHGNLAIFGNNGMMSGDAPKNGGGKQPQPRGIELESKKAFRMGKMPNDELASLRDSLKQQISTAVKSGKKVVVLDWGDPTLFGPQACNLKEFNELNPVIVPGVSCLNAGSAMLGMSIIGGGLGYGTLTLTNTPRASDEAVFPFSDPDQGLVLFTMRSDFSDSLKRLQAQFPGSTPIAIVMNAGFAETQQVIQATLDSIEDTLKGTDLPFEYLIYLGNFLSKRPS